MDIDELSSMQELAVPTFDHPVDIVLPNGQGNLLDLPTTPFYITQVMEGNTTRNSRQATSGRIVPTAIPARPENWKLVLKEIQTWGFMGNILLVDEGHKVHPKYKRYCYHVLACNLGRHSRTNDKRQEPRKVSIVLLLLPTKP